MEQVAISVEVEDWDGFVDYWPYEALGRSYGSLYGPILCSNQD